MAVAKAGASSVAKTKVRTRPRLMFGKKLRERTTQVVATLVITLGACVVMVPVIWMLSTSLKLQANVTTLPPQWIPEEVERVNVDGEDVFLYDVVIDGQTRVLAARQLDPERTAFFDPANPSQIIYAPGKDVVKHQKVVLHWENYIRAWTFQTTPFAAFMKNTLIYALVAVIGEVLSCSLVAYGFARLRAPGKDFLFLLVLGTMMLPGVVTLIPSYVLFTKYIPDFLTNLLQQDIKLADTWWPLWIPKFFGSAYLIFLIRQFFMSIPKDYDDAARIDGCGYFQTWLRIILPMSQPVLTAVAILSCSYHWNDYMGPLIYLNTTVKWPMSVGLANFQTAYGGTPWHLMMAASLIAVAPLVLIFFALNRYFVQGIVVSGIKG
jgi:multiple sugar transport system permease protein